MLEEEEEEEEERGKVGNRPVEAATVEDDEADREERADFKGCFSFAPSKDDDDDDDNDDDE